MSSETRDDMNSSDDGFISPGADAAATADDSDKEGDALLDMLFDDARDDRRASAEGGEAAAAPREPEWRRVTVSPDSSRLQRLAPQPASGWQPVSASALVMAMPSARAAVRPRAAVPSAPTTRPG